MTEAKQLELIKKNGLKRIVHHLRPNDLDVIEGEERPEFVYSVGAVDLDGELIPLKGQTEVKLYDDIDWMNLQAERSLLSKEEREKKQRIEYSLTPKVTVRAYCSHKEPEFNKQKGRMVATVKAIKALELKW